MQPSYDRQGNVIDNYNVYFRSNCVAATNFCTGVRVSTVHLVFDHGTGKGSGPLIFETMVFNSEGEDLITRRYSTEAEAIIGHNDVCKQYYSIPGTQVMYPYTLLKQLGLLP